MSAKVISLFNQAGGVGKTTLTQNLGYQLKDKGFKVLLIDIDPQASLTCFMGIEPYDLETTIYDALISEDLSISLPIINRFGVDLVPSNLWLAASEQKLTYELQRELRLKDILKPHLQDYDFIMIDCPPSLTLLPLISLVASDHVLVPIQTQFKATVGTDLLLDTIAKVKARLNPALQILGFIPTQFSKRNLTEQRVLDLLYKDLSSIAPILDPLPRSTAIAEATEYGKPFALSPKCNNAILSLFNSYAAHIESLTLQLAHV
jgi:chromosome partitioning protein